MTVSGTPDKHGEDYDYRQRDSETDENYAKRVVSRCDQLEHELASMTQARDNAVRLMDEAIAENTKLRGVISEVTDSLATLQANVHLGSMSEPAQRPPLAPLEEWSREVRLVIRGIDGQAKRRTHRSHYLGVTEEIIDGYQLNTGLWHRLLGLLASCPAPEGALASTPPSPLAAPSRAAILEEAAVAAEKKSDDPKDYTDQVEDYDYWRGYAKGREDAGTEIRMIAALSHKATMSADEVWDNWNAYLNRIDREDFRKQLHSIAVPFADRAELERLREFQNKIEEAEARCCPEDVGFEEWIGVLKKRLAPSAIDALSVLRRELQLDENGDSTCGVEPLAGWETGYCAGLRTAYRILKASTDGRGS